MSFTMEETVTSGKEIYETISNKEKFNPIQAQHKAALAGNIAALKGMSNNPGAILLAFMLSVLNGGGINEEELGQKGFEENGNYIQVAGDRITELSLTMKFIAAYGAEAGNIQSQLRRGGSIDGAIGSIDLLNTVLNEHPELFGGADSPTCTLLKTTLSGLRNNLSLVKQRYGTLDAFFDAVANKNDTTGAAKLNGDITEGVSIVTQATQTWNNSLQQRVTFDIGTVEQWQALCQTLLKSFNSVVSTATHNQKT